MVCSLGYRCFLIYSDWIHLHTELTFLKEIFQKNDFPENFVEKYLNNFLNNINLVKEMLETVTKKRSLLVLPYLEIISLQTKTKLQ